MRVFIYMLTFVTAFCALLYELLIARTVSLWAVNNAVWYASVIGIFIGGMGVGAWWGSRCGASRAFWQRLWQVELCVAVSGGLAVLLIHAAAVGALFLALSGVSAWPHILFFGAAFLTALAVGIGAGMELPLLLSLAEEGESRAKHESVAKVLLMDYSGALAAGVAFPLLVIPYISVLAAAYLAALLNVLAALFLRWRVKAAYGRKRTWALLFLLAGLFFTAQEQEKYFINKYYLSFQDQPVWGEFFKPKAYHGEVKRTRSPYQLIDFVSTDDIGDQARSIARAFIKPSDADSKALESTVLFLNHDFQFAVSFERIYHETFVHVPMAVLRSPVKRVLILGGGDGLVLREVLKYPEVEEVVLVDIDAGMVDLFRLDKGLADLNGQAFSDQRVRVIIGDAYQYVRQAKGKYDIIFCDFPNPVDYDLAKLYSREFYVFARRLLSDQAWLVMDAPGIDHDINVDPSSRMSWEIFYHTLRAASFKTIRPFFSRLETDNPQALEAVGGDQDALNDLAQSLTAGFVMAAADEREVELNPVRAKGLRVINDYRAKLSLIDPGSLKDEMNPRLVNSVFRPLLPLRPEWNKIKTGY